MLKDAGLIEKFAESLQSPIPALRVVEKNLAAAVALGFGKENASALIKALEKEAGVEVMRPQSQIARSTTHAPVFRQPRSSVSAIGNRTARTAPTSHSVAPNSAVRPSDNARNHIFAREDGSRHRDWDRRGAHFWNGHWWAWDGGYWIGLDDGFYPWDYYPYYAYDYYPYDYYPGYYADVEPYYNNESVYDSVPAADPNVTAVQNDLAKLGYYHGPVDGLYGRATRDAVARYQNDHHLAITGTLTTQTLQSLGVSPSVAS
jgi:hypothetical protein